MWIGEAGSSNFCSTIFRRPAVSEAAAALKAGRLKIVLEKFELPALPIHIVYPTSRLLSAKVRAFIDLVTEIDAWHFG